MPGRSTISLRHRSSRSAPITSGASTESVWAPTSTMIAGTCRDPGRRQRSSVEHTQLAHEAELVDDVPVLDDLTVGDAHDVDDRNRHLTPRCRQSLPGSRVSAAQCLASDDLVAFGDLVLDDGMEVGEGGEERVVQ